MKRPQGHEGSDRKPVAPFAHLGRHLRAARRAYNLSQRDLARRSGLDQAHVSRFEKGERLPTLGQLARLSAALAVPLQWFISGSERPGNGWNEMVVELYRLGVCDLFLGDAVTPGACRPAEEVLALAASGDRPSPRVVEALPAALAWNSWTPALLAAYADRGDGGRVLRRLAWLADIALTIHANEGFPGGAPGESSLSAFLRETERAPANRRPAEPDGLGYPALEGALPPVWRRWNITYAADLLTFRRRAEHLLSLREESAPPSCPGDDADE